MQHREFLIGRDPGVQTRWDPRNHGEIYALSEKGHVAHARCATSIEDVDDPSAFDFDAEKYCVPIREGEVVVFRNAVGAYAVVRVLSVLDADRGDPCHMLKFEYELRVPRSISKAQGSQAE
jgi:hypothetical protein